MHSGLWIRFLKVKEELRVMREERTKKENAYRLMQRESKQCDVIQKELTKLKESKVTYLLLLFVCLAFFNCIYLFKLIESGLHQSIQHVRPYCILS